MTTGQVQWNQKDPQQPAQGVTTALTCTCEPNGTIHMETPQSQGGFSADYSSPEEAAQELTRLFQQGITKASELQGS